VENIIIKYKGITLAAVIGVPQATGREDDPMYIVETPNPSKFNVQAFYDYCVKELPHYTLPRFIRVVKALPQTDTIKIQKKPLKRAFFMRTLELDNDPEDILFEVVKGKVKTFTTEDYRKELTKYKDPIAQDRLTIFTENTKLFTQKGDVVK
jgi:hypothetical protein